MLLIMLMQLLTNIMLVVVLYLNNQNATISKKSLIVILNLVQNLVD